MMKLPAAISGKAWQPFTPPGVAAFAYAPLRRLLLVQLVFAGLVAIVTVWFLHTAWLPVIREATAALPEEGQIRGGRLEWNGESPHMLASGSWLAVSVDVDRTGGLRVPSDVQVELTRERIRVLSLAGYVDLPYPRGWVIAANRVEVRAWWNAWEPALLVLAMGATCVGLLILWALQSAVYAVPALLISWIARRDAIYREIWKLSGAALLPGALLLVLGVLLYGLRVISLVQWLFIAGTHSMVGIAYAQVAVFFLPAWGSLKRRNPFAAK